MSTTGHAEREFAANILGTLALTVGDRVGIGTERAAGYGANAPAALVTLLWYPDRPITQLALRLRISHPGAVQLSERLEAAGLVDRFPGADEIDTSYKTTLDVIKAYPNLKGILGFGSNGPIGAGNAVREKRLGKKIAVVGTVLPSQAKDLIADGIIREGFLWNPTDAGYAMVAVARLVLDGKEIKDGVDIPGLGKASVDVPGKLIKVDKLMRINNETIAGLIAGGL